MSFANRQVICHRIREVFAPVFGRSAEDLGMHVVYDVSKRQWRGESLQRDLAARGIVVRAASWSGLAEEAAGAYKDIDDVVDATERAGISRRRAGSANAGHTPGPTVRVAGRGHSMMTIVTRVALKEGAEPEWDAAMHERMVAARTQPGWIGGQLLLPIDKLNGRLIIGTWETRAHWEAWHNDPAFADTRRRLEGLESGPSEHWWHEVIEEVRPPVTPLRPAQAAA